MRPLDRFATLVVLAALVVLLLPSEDAWACSCAEATIDEVLEREPDAAVVRIRRIDTDGGSSGVGAVETVLHGSDLPEQLPLALDDGGSCRPWVAVGAVAVLTFVRDGDGWRTLECGMLDPSAGLDDVQPDRTADGDVALIVTGRFPGADLVSLDGQLRVLSAARMPGLNARLFACEQQVLTTFGDGNGASSLVLLDPRELTVVDEHPLSSSPDSEVQLLDVSCADGRVDVITSAWGSARELHLRRDVFGDDRSRALRPAEDAAFAGNGIVLLVNSGDGAADGRNGERIHLAVHEVSTGMDRTLFVADGARGYELSVAPDGAHVLVRGHDGEPLLLVVEIASGTALARSSGSWQPVTSPWVDDERILQRDEGTGGVGGTGIASHRIVGLSLAPTEELAPTSGWSTLAGNDVIVRADAERITVHDASGASVRAATYPWAGGVHDGLALAEVVPDAQVHEDPVLIMVDPSVAHAARGDVAVATVGTLAQSFGPFIAMVVGGVAAAGVVIAVARRRLMRVGDGPR